MGYVKVLYKLISHLQSCSASIISFVSLGLSDVVTNDAILVPMAKTAVLLSKRLFQTSTEIKDSLAFTNNVKGLH